MNGIILGMKQGINSKKGIPKKVIEKMDEFGMMNSE
jgi:hypothetical protein